MVLFMIHDSYNHHFHHASSSSVIKMGDIFATTEGKLYSSSTVRRQFETMLKDKLYLVDTNGTDGLWGRYTTWIAINFGLQHH